MKQTFKDAVLYSFYQFVKRHWNKLSWYYRILSFPIWIGAILLIPIVVVIDFLVALFAS